MNSMRPQVLSLVVLGMVLSATHGQEPMPGKTLRLAVSPAAQPTPALAYRLLPPAASVTPGNAALDYARVDFDTTDTDDLLQTPLDKLSIEKLRMAIDRRREDLKELAEAARRQSCEWNPPPAPRYWTGPFLTSLSRCRMLGYWVALAARLHILEGNYDQAVHSLQTGYALARHVAQGPGLVPLLNAVSIERMMNDRVAELIGRPNSPNLYWALATLPRPMLDYHHAVVEEFEFAFAIYPILHDVGQSDRTPDEWRKAVSRQMDFMQSMHLLDKQPAPWQMSTQLLEQYPAAKHRLIAAGRSAEEVDKMPVVQLVLIDVRRDIDEFRDAMERWTLVEYFEGFAQAQEAEKHFRRQIGGRSFLAIPTYMPWLAAAWSPVVSNERAVAAMLAVEAIRMHAASHDGKPPVRLNEISEVPLPIDPVSGNPFGCEVVDATVILTAPRMSNQVGDVDRYEIQFKK